MRRWLTRGWAELSLRQRIVVSSGLLTAAVLVIGTVAVVAVFTAGRLRDVDTQTRTESDTLLSLVTTGQLPAVLPAPAGSSLLAQVLSSDGDVLASTPSASRTLALVDPASRGDAVVTDERGTYAGVPLRLRRTRTALAGRPVIVVVATPLGDVRRALASLRTVLLLVVPLLVIGAAGVVWWGAGRALRPVERLRAAAEALARDPAAAGAGAQLPGYDGDDEIARLARTLNELLAALGRLIRQQSAFVEDAAHELRSPLASLQVQLDIASAHPDLVDLPRLLDDLALESARLGRLTEDLLVLARMERGPSLASRPVDLTALAGTPGPAVLVLGDDRALRRLLDNLLVNAHRHASTVRVQVTAQSGMAVLDVDDDGPGIPADDWSRIFDRWVRLDDSRARQDGGVGLGLALVREIARLHGGQVQVDDSPLGGARFRVRLPLVTGVVAPTL